VLPIFIKHDDVTGEAKTYAKLEDLFPWDKNPKGITKDQYEKLKVSLRKGQFEPLLVTYEGEVIGGNQRLPAMTEIGYKDAWISLVNPASEAEKFDYAVRHNHMYGFWEDDKLAELAQQYAGDLDLSSLSIRLNEGINLEKLLKNFGPNDVETKNYNEEYQVVIECANEIEQREHYEKLVAMGYTCKVLTL